MRLSTCAARVAPPPQGNAYAGPGDDDDDETPIGDPDDDEDYADDDDEDEDDGDTLWALDVASVTRITSAPMR